MLEKIQNILRQKQNKRYQIVIFNHSKVSNREYSDKINQ